MGNRWFNSFCAEKFYKIRKIICMLYRSLQIMIATLLIKASINKRFVICHGLLLTYRQKCKISPMSPTGRDRCVYPRHETVYTLHSFYTAHCTKAMTTHIRELTGCQYDSFLLVTMLLLGSLIGYQLGLPLNIITCIS